MSTRSMIGHYRDHTCTEWEAVYCHFDGYPEGVGDTLVRNWRDHFEGNTQAIVDFIMSTQVGWSSLTGADFSKPPTWDIEDNSQPRWYDDRPGEDPSVPVRFLSSDGDFGWCEYGYLFHVDKNRLDVFKLHQQTMTLIEQHTVLPQTG